ncbi:MAG TPA: 16S rRNA (adenine(1518)-N(6)/adenine(1519)-N(6))-dimethyltransferase RsmA [Anaerolineae bacterium]|jgi:16S rRNA (adenine1518-N6/adenine1519-N6)-dimethyltransferase|nr:16S rRNA (adenine(1518)-N(6)/adenine(1519)-N(6))-dimethyltransferase RsmA [Anaerolineae bacterium]
MSAVDSHGLQPSSVVALLRQFNLRPQKGLGQNFLVSERLRESIIEAAALTKDDVVLEVGAGLGTLTYRLAQECRRVFAIELDQRLIPLLHQTLLPFDNVDIVQGDILNLRPGELVSSPYKVVGNLPYNITSAVLRHFLEADTKPSLLVVTVQREVAERIVAGPGDMSLLAVSVQFYSRARIVARAPSGAFYPSPRVRSAVVRLDVHPEPQVEVDDTDRFFDVVRAGFAQRRKQLRNSLSQGLGLAVDEVVEALRRAGIDERQRPQELTIEQWAQVSRELTPAKHPSGRLS